MATVPAPNPFLMGDSKLTLGTDDGFEAHVSSAMFTPANNAPVSWKGLTPTSRFSKTPRADWTLDLGYAQDWDEAQALARFLYDHEGEDITATLEPINGGPGATATVSITPGAIGGEVDTVAVGTVSLGSTRPVLDAVTP